MIKNEQPTFLVVRRDNIGDLVCTTPVFTALRAKFPQAKILVLTNTYSLPILHNNPNIDRAYAYTKAHHRQAGTSLWSVYRARVRVVLELRKAHIDYAILASCGFARRALRFARLARPRHIIGYVGERGAKGIDMPVRHSFTRPLHEVEDVFRILEPLGIGGPPPPLFLQPVAAEVDRVRAALSTAGVTIAPTAIHISARLPSNRWPTARFVSLIKELATSHARQFILLWSPGDEKNPHHPGDDAKAREIMTATAGIKIAAYPTSRLEELIAALSVSESVVCSDGGAMHIAAALGKPIVCFFGDSDPERWHPWGVPHVVLQTAELHAESISVDAALGAYEWLSLR